MQNYPKYLPIGSVIMLKGGSKRIMITGFCSISGEDSEKVYDYSGCLYPEGYLSSTQVCLFDHSQIEKIYCLGYKDDEQKEFMAKLNVLTQSLEAAKKTESE